VQRIKNPRGKVTIAIVGKYINLRDSYKSLCEALIHGGLANNVDVSLRLVDATEIESKGPQEFLSDVNGVIVPGGFGNRGIEGKIAAIQYSREHKIPFFGICLGMQCAVIEFARHVAGFNEANSTEFDEKTAHPVIHIMPDQEGKDKGGTMRLGAYPCILMPDSTASQAYKSTRISERHRHRYEFNNFYRDNLIKAGMVISGLYPQKDLVEIVEIKDHPWFLATQFHPEFKSKPTAPHPLFASFIGAAVKQVK